MRTSPAGLPTDSGQRPPPEDRFNVIGHQLAVAAPRLGAEIWFHGHQRRLEKGPKPKSRRAARPALGYALLNPPQLCKGIAAGTSVNILATLAWDGQIRAAPPILQGPLGRHSHGLVTSCSTAPDGDYARPQNGCGAPPDPLGGLRISGCPRLGADSAGQISFASISRNASRSVGERGARNELSAWAEASSPSELALLPLGVT